MKFKIQTFEDSDGDKFYKIYYKYWWSLWMQYDDNTYWRKDTATEEMKLLEKKYNYKYWKVEE